MMSEKKLLNLAKSQWSTEDDKSIRSIEVSKVIESIDSIKINDKTLFLKYPLFIF